MMKYDLDKKPTRGAQRTLLAFSQTMFQLLAQKPFEKINVNEICQLCNFPRATFYNYFDDKYDLINYCWYVLAEKVHIEEADQLKPNEVVIIYFDRLYDLFENNSQLVLAILRHNQISGNLVNSFTNYLRNLAHKMFLEVFGNLHFDVPVELMVDHCSSTILLLIEWIFLKKQPTTRKQAHNYLAVLLGDPETTAVQDSTTEKPTHTGA